MVSNPKKRQKKLERRTAKRKEKKHLLVREQNVGLADKLSAAARFPVLDCWISSSLEEQGLGWVVLSREIPQGEIAVANFLVDRYCLGVKNVFAEIVNRSTYESKIARRMRTEMSARTAPPAEARKLVEEAVAYARSIGFPPHADYAKAVVLFGDVDPSLSDAKFEFGKDGKPFFISGPNDSPQRCREIISILSNTCAPGQFDFLAGMGGGGGAIPSLTDGLSEEDLDEEEE